MIAYLLVGVAILAGIWFSDGWLSAALGFVALVWGLGGLAWGCAAERGGQP